MEAGEQVVEVSCFEHVMVLRHNREHVLQPQGGGAQGELQPIYPFIRYAGENLEHEA